MARPVRQYDYPSGVPHRDVVASTAIKTAQQGSYVFVVKPDSTAEQRTFQTARTYEDLTVIEQGLNPGEQVIIEGQLRVKARHESPGEERVG